MIVFTLKFGLVNLLVGSTLFNTFLRAALVGNLSVVHDYCRVE